jgi:hypothetical protein
MAYTVTVREIDSLPVDISMGIEPANIKLVQQWGPRPAWSVISYYDKVQFKLRSLVVEENVSDILIANNTLLMMATAIDTNGVQSDAVYLVQITGGVIYVTGNPDGTENIVYDMGDLTGRGYTQILGLINAKTFSRAVTGVNLSLNTFTVGGNRTAEFIPNQPFYCTGSTANDGLYSVVSSSLVIGDTVIVVKQSIPDDTVDGTLKA